MIETVDMPVYSRYMQFVRHHLNHVRKGGLRVFLRKISRIVLYYRAIHAILLFIPLLPVVIFVRLIRPFLLVRFGVIENQRIGHYAVNPELYLCERDAGLQPNRSLDIFYKIDPTYTANRQLERMWKRSGRIRVWEVARFMYLVNRCLPGYEKHIAVLPIDRDIHDLYSRYPTHISFTDEEEKKGWEALREMGIPEGSKFVCLHSRDPEYLNAAFPGGEWHYQNHRDSNIDNFIPAAEELASRGLYVVRMGAVVRKPLTADNPHIIDYATRSRTEFLDIFLSAKCTFYLGDPCGMNAIPFVFRRPIISTNFIPLEYIFTWSDHDVSITKKLWLRSEKRFMTFREIMESGAGRFVQAQQYEALGIEVVENSPDEIAALAIEAEERARGVIETTEEDRELQRLFWNCFKPSDLNQVFRAHIGAQFLRENRSLLE